MRKLIGVLALSSMILTACPPAPPPPPPTVQARFVHASTDGGNVDLYIDTAKINGTNAVTPKTTFPATGYSTITLGSSPTKLDVCAANSTNCPIKASDLNFTANTIQTVLILGSPAGSGANALGTTILTDNNSAPNATNFKLRIVNASAGNPALDVYITAPNDPLNSVIPATVNYKAATTYLERSVQSVQIRVTTSGSTTPIIDTQSSLAFSGGKVYTLVLVGPTAGYVLLTDN